jgi:glycosyltransferase involved in cell wall biosynthesis
VPRATLSVVVIARNEERNLGRCLDSVAWAQERIVVDANSTDGTRDVAERRGARVIVQPWLGFRDQKNVAVDAATMEWVLSLDADEWLPAETVEEVKRALEKPWADVYAFSRKTAVSAGFLRYAYGKDLQARLFRRGHARFGGGEVHERLEVAQGEKVAAFEEPILHRTYRSFSEYAARMNRYSDLGARAMAGRPVSLLRLGLSPPAAFFKMYVLRGGFLDGVRGLVVAAGQAHYVLLKYAKHWEAKRPADPEFARLVPPTAEDPDPQSP